MTDLEEIPYDPLDDYITQEIQAREQQQYHKNRNRLQTDLLIAEALLDQLRHHIQDALAHLDDDM